MRRSRKALVAVATAGTLAVGGLGFAAVGMPVASSAQTTGTSTAASGSSSSGSSSSTVPAADPLATALRKLVADHTITQAQADAVQQAVRDEAGNRPFPGRRGEGPGLDAAAQAIGVGTSELSTQLRDGETIAEVAKAHGVDVSKVIAAMVADAQSHLDQAVANGRLTQAQADQQRSQLTGRITDLVHDGPSRAGEPGSGRPPWSHGPAAHGPASTAS